MRVSRDMGLLGLSGYLLDGADRFRLGAE